MSDPFQQQPGAVASRPSALTLYLCCPARAENFAVSMPNQVEWLAKHWNNKTKMRCRVCGSAHSYAVKNVYIDQVLAQQVLAPERA